VDSAVSVLLLQEQGYAVGGATMLLQPCGLQEAEDAAQSAQRLGIEFHVFDWQAQFRRDVIEPFKQVYVRGGTPNPCIFCNKALKFGAFLEQALALGYDGVATGHYARVKKENGRYLLYTAEDCTKDQTYMLWSLSQDVLSHVRFPLGQLTKTEVREIAAAHGFTNAQRKDSQDICFIPDGNYVDFIRRYAGHTPTPGHFVDADGRVLGDHAGMLHYTIGQRKGLGVAFGHPVYVLDKNARTGEVVLGENEALLRRTPGAHSVNWISGIAPKGALRVQAKIRYAHDAADATVWQTDEHHIRVEFDTPQRAIARGQSVVLYDGDVLLGGGIIE
jgi:tRNA-specific 2-thiouridylase